MMSDLETNNCLMKYIPFCLPHEVPRYGKNMTGKIIFMVTMGVSKPKPKSTIITRDGQLFMFPHRKTFQNLTGSFSQGDMVRCTISIIRILPGTYQKVIHKNLSDSLGGLEMVFAKIEKSFKCSAF